MAQSDAGRELHAAELKKRTSKASIPLLVIAIFQFIACVGFFTLSGSSKGDEKSLMMFTGIILVVMGLIFVALSVWARKNPLPAAIVGLVLLGSLWTLNALVDPASFGRGLIFKIIIVIALMRAISAGVEHRKLLKQYPAA